MKKFLFITLYFLCLSLNADVLLWSVGESSVVHLSDGTSTDIYTFVSPYYTDDDFPAARVKITGGQLAEPIILPIYIDEGESYDGYWGVALDDSGSGYWGSYLNHSKIPSELGMEFYFQIELGHGLFNESLDDWEWETIAYSDYASRTDIDREIYEEGSISPPEWSIWGWNPTDFYEIDPVVPDHSVPEPTSLKLLLMGSALLLLKRKERTSV